MSLQQWIKNHTTQNKGFMKSFEAAAEFHSKVVSELRLYFFGKKELIVNRRALRQNTELFTD